MRLHVAKYLAFLLLLIGAPLAFAVDHQVQVGGSTGDGQYTYPVYMFNPSTLTVVPGDTVTFVNRGGVHNVHADDESFRCAVSCDGTGGDPSQAAWSSTVTIPASAAGSSIAYHCDVHSGLGMTGTITVSGGSTGGNVPITSGFTGAWYDPTQSGHGIFIEVLPNNQMLAWWFTFNPDGTQQTWFGNVGTIDGDTGTVAALTTLGGRWIPNFNPANITQPDWGTLTFHFTDCNHGRVDFAGVIAGYGTGHMDLTRLTLPAGLTCQ